MVEFFKLNDYFYLYNSLVVNYLLNLWAENLVVWIFLRYMMFMAIILRYIFEISRFQQNFLFLTYSSVFSLAFQHWLHGSDWECAFPAWLIKGRVQWASPPTGDADRTEQVRAGDVSSVLPHWLDSYFGRFINNV